MIGLNFVSNSHIEGMKSLHKSHNEHMLEVYYRSFKHIGHMMTVPIYIPAIQKHLLFEITHLCRMRYGQARGTNYSWG